VLAENEMAYTPGMYHGLDIARCFGCPDRDGVTAGIEVGVQTLPQIRRAPDYRCCFLRIFAPGETEPHPTRHLPEPKAS
jgi:hypothetical protein